MCCGQIELYTSALEFDYDNMSYSVSFNCHTSYTFIFLLVVLDGSFDNFFSDKTVLCSIKFHTSKVDNSDFNFNT